MMENIAHFLRSYRTPLAALVAATHNLNTGNTAEQSIHFAFFVFAFYWALMTFAAYLASSANDKFGSLTRAENERRELDL